MRKNKEFTLNSAGKKRNKKIQNNKIQKQRNKRTQNILAVFSHQTDFFLSRCILYRNQAETGMYMNIE